MLRFIACHSFSPQVSVATAHVLLHRFFCKCSLTDNNIRIAALTTLWLATKLEEAHVGTIMLLQVYDRVTRRQTQHDEWQRSMAMETKAETEIETETEEGAHGGREIANTSQKMRFERLPVLEPQSRRYCELHARMIYMERTILESLGFICHVEHPHKLVIYITNVILNCDKELCQTAWSLCNDRYAIKTQCINCCFPVINI